jgi:hypothetical protein
VKLGAEPRKVVVLALLLAVAGYLMYTNVIAPGNSYGPPSSPATATTQAPAASRPNTPEPPRSPNISRDRRASGSNQEWVPTLKPRRPEDQPDPMTVDPTLRLDLLAKLQAVELGGGHRSLFEFSQPPPPKAPEPTIKPKPVEAAKTDTAKPEEKPSAPVDPPRPPPPPIPLKFYGFIAGSGARRAFFLNGEDILVGSEGQTLQTRYRIVRIGLSSAVIEDTEHKNQQTIRLEEPPQGGN